MHKLGSLIRTNNHHHGCAATTEKKKLLKNILVFPSSPALSSLFLPLPPSLPSGWPASFATWQPTQLAIANLVITIVAGQWGIGLGGRNRSSSGAANNTDPPDPPGGNFN